MDGWILWLTTRSGMRRLPHTIMDNCSHCFKIVIPVTYHLWYDCSLSLHCQPYQFRILLMQSALQKTFFSTKHMFDKHNPVVWFHYDSRIPESTHSKLQGERQIWQSSEDPFKYDYNWINRHWRLCLFQCGEQPSISCQWAHGWH